MFIKIVLFMFSFIIFTLIGLGVVMEMVNQSNTLVNYGGLLLFGGYICGVYYFTKWAFKKINGVTK